MDFTYYIWVSNHIPFCNEAIMLFALVRRHKLSPRWHDILTSNIHNWSNILEYDQIPSQTISIPSVLQTIILPQIHTRCFHNFFLFIQTFKSQNPDYTASSLTSLSHLLSSSWKMSCWHCRRSWRERRMSWTSSRRPWRMLRRNWNCRRRRPQMWVNHKDPIWKTLPRLLLKLLKSLSLVKKWLLPLSRMDSARNLCVWHRGRNRRSEGL